MMRHRWMIVGAICVGLALSGVAYASKGDVATIIERFVVKQFPDAASHFWIINNTQWDGDEMVVDINAVVLPMTQPNPVVNRFLLLIVDGRLTAAQNVPLESEAECRAEET